MMFRTSRSLIGIFFQKQTKKRSVTCVPLTFSPRQGLPPVVQVLSGSLAIAALATLLRSVSSPHWCSPAALSIAGVWVMVLYCTPSKPLMFCPAVFQPGSWNLLLHSRLSPSSADALVAHSSRAFDRWLLSHWRFFAALFPRPVVLDVLALLSWRCQPCR